MWQAKRKKPLEDNITTYVCDPAIGTKFTKYKRKSNVFDFIKVMNFYLTEDIIETVKRQQSRRKYLHYTYPTKNLLLKNLKNFYKSMRIR